MYPGPSDFSSNATSAAWYRRSQASGLYRCATDGANLVTNARAAAASALAGLGPSPTYDGTTVDAATVPSNPAVLGWGPALAKALYAIAARSGVAAAYMAALQTEASEIQAGASVGEGFLRLGIALGDVLAVADDNPGVLAQLPSALATLYLPPGYVPPRWGAIAPPLTNQGNSLCAFESANPVPPPSEIAHSGFAPNPWIVGGVILAVGAGVAWLTARVSTGASLKAKHTD